MSPEQLPPTPRNDGGITSVWNTDETTQIINLDIAQFRAFLKALAKQAGFIADLASQLGVSPQFMGDVIAGRKNAGPKLLSKLGVRVETRYVVTVSHGEETE